MIDRSYLPFQSAREHQDRGMMKWMGFFLSEHTSSLHEDKTKENFRSHLDDLEKFTLLNQLYSGQLLGNFCTSVREFRKKTTSILPRVCKGRD